MSTAELEPRLLRRRTAFRAALRRGGVITVARSWERLRGAAAAQSPEEVLAARAARTALGRAIRAARWRRTHPMRTTRSELSVAMLPARGPVRRGTFAVACAVLTAVALIVFLPRDARPAPAAAPPAQARVPAATPEPAGGRGRTTATAAPAVALSSATPVPTPEPTAAPTPAPAATSGPPRTAAPAGQPGGAVGGVPGGQPGGVAGGTIGGGGAATPRPTPSPAPTLNVLPQTPPPMPRGANRFYFRVVDRDTRATLANVCVIYGTVNCGPSDPHTNTLGNYWLDASPNSSRWTFYFVRADYWPQTVDATYEPGMGSTPILVFMRRR